MDSLIKGIKTNWAIIAVVILIAIVIAFVVYTVVVDSKDNQKCVTGRAPDVFTVATNIPQKSDFTLDWSYSGSDPTDLVGFTVRRSSGDEVPVETDLPVTTRTYTYHNLDTTVTNPAEILFEVRANFRGGCSSQYYSTDDTKISLAALNCDACVGTTVPTFTLTPSIGTVAANVSTSGNPHANVVAVLKEGTSVSKTDYDKIFVGNVTNCSTFITSYGILFRGLKPNTQYAVAVYATTGCGSETALSPVQTATTPACAFPAPTSTTSAENSAMNDIHIVWKDITDVDPGVELEVFLKYGGSAASAENFDSKLTGFGSIDYYFTNMRRGKYTVAFRTIGFCGDYYEPAPISLVIE